MVPPTCCPLPPTQYHYPGVLQLHDRVPGSTREGIPGGTQWGPEGRGCAYQLYRSPPSTILISTTREFTRITRTYARFPYAPVPPSLPGRVSITR